MTSEQKNQIENLRKQGLGYATIAQALGVSKSTVTSHCQRNNLGGIKSNGTVLDKKVLQTLRKRDTAILW